MYKCHDWLILFIASYTGSADDPLADLSEVLNTDDDILGILSDDLVKSGDHSGMYVNKVSPVFIFFFFPLYSGCLCCILGYALGDFRYNFPILRIPWFEMNLLSSTRKIPQPFQHFVLLGSLLCCLRENKM